jgi:hypothetical protein
MTQESKDRAMIGSSMELEMNKRHRIATMGCCKAAKNPGHEVACGYPLPVVVNKSSFWSRLVTGIDEASE